MSPKSHTRSIRGKMALAVLATVGVVSGGVAVGTRSDPPPAGGSSTANFWTDSDGGTCTRQATAAVYNDAAACANPVVPWVAASSGDVIRMKAKSGGYNMPTTPNIGHFTGDKTSDTKIIGDEAGVIINTGATAGEFEVDGHHFWLENVTLDSGSVHGWSARIGGSGPDNADDVTFKNVSMKGLYVGLELFTGDRFTWDGGTFGESGVAGLRCTGDIEPIQVNGGTGHHFTNMIIYPQGGSNSACGGDGFHEEDMRIHSSNTLIENIDFKDGNAVNRNAGSGKIFLSGSAVQNLVLRNIIFGRGEPSSNNHIDANVTGCTVTIAYVTYTDKGTNLAGCTVTNIQNIGPNDAGVSVTTGRLSSGAGIDGAENGTGADYCVNALGSRDFEGDPRPLRTKCDKGADEIP